MGSRFSLVSLFLVVVGLAACSRGKVTAQPLKVAAAADLALAFKEIGSAFERDGGSKVVFTFGSTGLLSKQIAEGAPFDVFAAANVSFVEDLVQAGACDGATKALYARGRIVLWTSNSNGEPAPNGLMDLAGAKFKKISIANPEHAPYGKAAKEALEDLNLWTAVSPKLVYGENVQQALQFAQTGNTEAAIVALSLMKTAEQGRYVLIEEKHHRPINQALVVCKHGQSAATGAKFALFVNSEAGRAIMRKYGFLLPGEAVAVGP